MPSAWKNVQWYKELLLDKRNEKQDLNYWIDHVKTFGAEHKIPTYNNLSLLKYYNVDLLAFGYLIVWVLWSIVESILAMLFPKKAEKEK